MHRCLYACLLLPLLLGAAPALPPPGEQVYGLVERSFPARLFELPAHLNPYDPDEVRVDAEIVEPGTWFWSGRRLTLPCFWYLPMRPSYSTVAGTKGPETWERFQATGDGEWRFRFSPQRPGLHRFQITVTTRAGRQAVLAGNFPVAATPAAPLPLRLDERRRGFAYADGRPFIPLGHNLGWAGGEGARQYAEWLRRLGEAGGNCSRLWLTHFFAGTALTWTATGANDGYRNYREFSQESGARLDAILASARQHGIYLILSFDSFGDTTWDWPRHPLAKLNGGWLERPAELFTDSRARAVQKAELRYLIARFGWSSQVWAWEFWNEVDLATGYDAAAVRDWHRDLAATARALDPHARLLTTSYCRLAAANVPSAFSLPGIDFAQAHIYSPELWQAFPEQVQTLARYGKPVLLSEFSLDTEPGVAAADPVGLNLHDGLWCGLLAGGAGGALSWWWDDYIHGRDLYGHYRGIARLLPAEALGDPLPGTLPDAPDALALARRVGARGLMAWVAQPRWREWRSRYQPGSRSFAVGLGTYGVVASTALPTRLELDGGFGGRFQVEYLDPYDGVVVGAAVIAAAAGRLTVPLLPFRHDLALRLTPTDAPPAPPRANGAPTPWHDEFARRLAANQTL